MKKRRKSPSRRRVQIKVLGAGPPRIWHAQLDLSCAGHKQTITLPGPTVKEALRKATTKSAWPVYAAKRCRVLKTSIVAR